MNISTLQSTTTRQSRIAQTPLLFLLVFILMASNLYAAGVSLTWNANSESDLAGYHIYQRLLTSNEYGSPAFSGLPSNPTTPQKTISNLLAGTTYEFIATAFDSSGNESPTSNEFIVSTLSNVSENVTTGGNTKGNTAGSTGSNGNLPAAITSPAPGSTLSSTTVTLIGGHATGNVFHSLWVGTAQGSSNLSSGSLSNHSKTISALPSQGTIYVRYWSTNSDNSSDPNAWSFTDQTYTMAIGSMSTTMTNTPVSIPVSAPPVSTPPVSTPLVSAPPVRSAVSAASEPDRHYTRQYQRKPDLPRRHEQPRARRYFNR